MNMTDGPEWARPGYTTPYGNGRSEWDAPQGAATPYGATPYGQNGANGWN
jgi:DNA-directed RNA polymerase II subunit RPB3